MSLFIYKTELITIVYYNTVTMTTNPIEQEVDTHSIRKTNLMKTYTRKTLSTGMKRMNHVDWCFMMVCNMSVYIIGGLYHYNITL